MEKDDEVLDDPTLSGQEVAPAVQNGDPLDELFKTNPEAVLAEAKKSRAILNRNKGKEAVKVEAPTAPVVVSNYLTKDDMHRVNTKRAKEMVGEAVLERWEDVLSYVPPKYKDAETPEEIAKAMKIGYTAWQEDNPNAAPKADNPAAALQTTQGGKGTAPKGTEPAKPALSIPRAIPPKEWYPKKS